MAARKLVTLKEAIQIINESFGYDPAKNDNKDLISIKTIYNALAAKKIKKYGKHSYRQVDVAEILMLFGPQKAG